ncbi:shikimate kinase [Ascidiimonas sp. W6]|uniref:shikimate kinase n=1 Tax=Ascidiimonas meishanensis TaxID=3128903 RepID=UPI0030EBE5FA
MIILIGYMGSGKSTIGRVLSKSLQKKYYDLDHFIEKKENSSISKIFQSKGEIYFRRRERELLQELLIENEDIILSLGGGTPCFGDTMEIIKNATPNVFYLKLSVQALTERLKHEKGTRPLISHLETDEALEEFIRKHIFERNFYYLQAHKSINADHKSAEVLAQEIMELL